MTLFEKVAAFALGGIAAAKGASVLLDKKSKKTDAPKDEAPSTTETPATNEEKSEEKTEKKEEE